MKLWMIFALICVLCLGAYALLFTMITTTPSIAVGLGIPLMITGWGAGAFFILALVMLILRR